MTEYIQLSTRNTLPLLEHIEGFSESTKNNIQAIREAVLLALRDDEIIIYDKIIQVIDSVFETQATEFINGDITNMPGERLGSLKILTLAILMGLGTDAALKLFGERWIHVQNTPQGGDYPNIRQLDRVGIEGVKINGLPITEKS